MSIDAQLSAIAVWQKQTFGTPDPAGIALKVQAEAAEFAAEVLACTAEDVPDGFGLTPEQERLAEEGADLVFLVVDGFRAAGIPTWALAEALARKLAKNKARTWRRGEDGQWSHVKGGTA